MPLSAKMGSVSEFLVVYLDSIDERLLDYLDEDEELRPEAVKRLRYYASAMLEGSITPAAVAEDWEDYFDLAQAFALTYGSQELEEMQDAAMFLQGSEVGDDAPLTDEDRAYLVALEGLLDMYPEMRLEE